MDASSTSVFKVLYGLLVVLAGAAVVDVAVVAVVVGDI